MWFYINSSCVLLEQKKWHFSAEGLLFSFSYISLSFFSLCFLPSPSLLQALVNTNSFCQGICGCVWIETETWEHWACLLLIEYAWLRLPGAVSDEENENVNVSGAVVDSQRPLQFTCVPNNDPWAEEWIAFELEYLAFHPAFNWFRFRTKSFRQKFFPNFFFKNSNPHRCKRTDNNLYIYRSPSCYPYSLIYLIDCLERLQSFSAVPFHTQLPTAWTWPASPRQLRHECVLERHIHSGLNPYTSFLVFMDTQHTPAFIIFLCAAVRRRQSRVAWYLSLLHMSNDAEIPFDHVGKQRSIFGDPVKDTSRGRVSPVSWKTW